MRLRTSLVIALAVLMFSACDPNGDPIGPIDTKRSLPSDFSSRQAVAYSGYRAGQSPATQVYPSEAEILEDLRLLKEGGFGLIRLFASDEMSTRTLRVIDQNNLDIKAMLGIWISGSKAQADAANQAEIARGVALAKQYDDIVLAVSVGNETMVTWSMGLPPADIASYIRSVRSQIDQPVTTDDNWAVFANSGNAYPEIYKVLQVADFVSMHTYPLADSLYDLWDWKQEDAAEAVRAAAMMDAAMVKAKADYSAVTDYLGTLGLDIPVVIGETGWKSAASGGEAARAHPVNQKMYYDRLGAWTDGPEAIFYFEAFDEPWKGGDDFWGLFDVNRLAKYTLYELFPSDKQSESYTEADALYYVAPVPNPPIDKATYVVFRDAAISAEEAQPTVDPNTGETMTEWIGWNNPWTSELRIVTSDASEGANALEVTPVPESWGWGGFLNLEVPDDLSVFDVSTGMLKFSIKTSYPGKLEFGFLTGTPADRDACDVYLAVAPGSYGYQNDGAWHEVSVPLSAIIARATPAYGMPSTATRDMTMVTNAFVVADRYATTGNSTRSTSKILIDNIRWTR